MKFVTKRKIDELGMIVIPIEFRRFFNLSAGDSVEMKATKYDIIISKATAEQENVKTNTYGEITMVIRYRYFVKIESGEELLLETLHNHPELTAELLAERQKEVDAILNDPKLSKHIKEAADRVGVTPEEYLDRLDDVMNEEPAQFVEMLQNYMDKREKGEIKED